jgi:hypothetical protein
LNSNGQCVACSAPSWWDSASNTCKSCPVGLIYKSAGNCVCPSDKPYQTKSGACVSCNAPQHWNI